MSEVRIKHISKSFGDTHVLEDVSLHIQPNEFVVFLGPSGCGKSTLLRMVAGLETADTGEIWIGDRRVDMLPPGQRDVAMVFQHYALYPHMSVRENMAFGLRNTGVNGSEITRRLNDAAKMLEIEALLDRKPAQISGGQRQRVAIGRAIVKEPHVFLFDEPLSNLDAALRARTRIEIAQLHRRIRAAMIFVTHDQVEAMTLADRVIVMNDQRIEQVGTPMEVYSRPASRFVAGFVGSPAMNLLPVTTSQSGRYTVIHLPDNRTVNSTIPFPQESWQGDLSFGIRAESISICASAEGDTSGSVKFVERLGDKSLIYIELAGDCSVIAEDVGNSKVAMGEAVGLRFDPAGMHLFDATRACHAESPS